jgi:hypothetical protein
LSVSLGGNEEIELALFTGENLDTGKTVSVGEIEVHGFTSARKAEKSIRTWEKTVGWKSFRTRLSMSKLLLALKPQPGIIIKIPAVFIFNIAIISV